MADWGLKIGSTGDNYGQRIKGVIVPPFTGNYRFWIASDDASELWLSTTKSRLQKQKIAFVGSWTNVDAFDATPSQKSASIPLTAGQPYYYEILHKEGTGGDHVSAAWVYEPTNWAAATSGATATQSSNYSSTTYLTATAIDGNTAGTGFTHTANQQNSWWQVDFGQTVSLNRVVIYNRSTNQDRLSNFRISVLNSSGSEVAGQNFFVGSGNASASVTWNLPSTISGRKVKVSLLGYNNSGNGYLSLAEVQVYEWQNVADRQIVAAAYLRSEYAEPLDQDGDSLPDAWEIQYGLSASDNGATALAQGEYGDPDGDGVPNLYEYKNNTAPNAPNGTPSTLQRDTWWAIGGGSIQDLVTAPGFLQPSDLRDTVTAWQTANRADYYGQRYRGTYTAQTTGWHTFWIAGDNACALYFNDGTLAAGQNAAYNAGNRKFAKRPIATVGGLDYMFGAPSTGATEYDKFPSQKSAPVYLTAGSSYYLEVLHKEDYAGDFFTVSVQDPVSTRVTLPFTSLTSFTYDIDDDDDDNLPDIWESTYGLNPGDNGRFSPGREGERGDFDGDGLTNYEEYLAGSNPASADTDGDGIDDYAEIKTLGSNPAAADSGAGTAMVSLAGSAGTQLAGTWITGPNGTMLGLDRRGTLGYPFTLPTPGGIKLLSVSATPQGNAWAGETLALDVKIVRTSDNKTWSIGSFPVRENYGNPSTLITLLPWLPAGSYRVELKTVNVSETRNIRLDAVTILNPSGADSDSNGIADWLDTRVAQGNGLTFAPASSAVSPVCLEGVMRFVGEGSVTAGGTGLALQAAGDHRFYANASLPSSGAAVTVAASFESGLVQQSTSIAWTPTNVFTTSTMKLRKADALRLTAFNGTAPDAGAVTLTVGSTNYTTTADAPVAVTFNIAGTIAITATYTPVGGSPVSASMSVQVIDASFGSNLVLRSDRWRDWTLPNISSSLPLQTDSSIFWEERPTTTAGARVIRVSATADKPVNLVARTAPDGSIAARGTVDPYLLGDNYDSGYVEILETLPGGVIHGRITIVADRLPAGGYVQLAIWAGGAQFANGATTKNLFASAFDGSGVAKVDVYYPSANAISSFCHYVRLYDASNTLLSGY